MSSYFLWSCWKVENITQSPSAGICIITYFYKCCCYLDDTHAELYWTTGSAIVNIFEDIVGSYIQPFIVNFSQMNLKRYDQYLDGKLYGIWSWIDSKIPLWWQIDIIDD